MRTYAPKPQDLERAWFLIDADGLVLGRLASEVARILKGKHRPYVAPNVDTGDHVVIVNADKVVMTAGKAGRTVRYTHSGYPGGISARTYAKLLEERPEEVVRQAVRGMLPKTTLGRQMLLKLKVYAGPDHPHTAQSPELLELPMARQAS